MAERIKEEDVGDSRINTDLSMQRMLIQSKCNMLFLENRYIKHENAQLRHGNERMLRENEELIQREKQTRQECLNLSQDNKRVRTEYENAVAEVKHLLHELDEVKRLKVDQCSSPSILSNLEKPLSPSKEPNSINPQNDKNAVVGLLLGVGETNIIRIFTQPLEKYVYMNNIKPHICVGISNISRDLLLAGSSLVVRVDLVGISSDMCFDANPWFHGDRMASIIFDMGRLDCGIATFRKLKLGQITSFKRQALFQFRFVLLALKKNGDYAEASAYALSNTFTIVSHSGYIDKDRNLSDKVGSVEAKFVEIIDISESGEDSKLKYAKTSGISRSSI